MNLSLNGKWKVTHLPYQSDLAEILHPSFVPEGWISANVPEDIHATLRRAGDIRGNTYAKKETEDTWIEEQDWIYYKEFYMHTLSKTENKSVELVFNGLDTYCEVYLNGHKIGYHENMFVPLYIDVTPYLKMNQRNVLILRFFSSVFMVRDREQGKIFSITTSDRIFTRKAQMNYSWDFCARCVTAGIWKSVVLRTKKTAEILSYYLCTLQADTENALLSLETETSLPLDSGYYLSVTLSFHGDIVYRHTGSMEEFISLEIPIINPCLWWPRPYGVPNLYDFKLELKKDTEIIDVKVQKFGIRTIQVLQEKQEDGLSFQFSINGRKLFIRGANWVPLNTVYTDIKEKDYRELIHFAVKGNISMLRIWGGGIYENPLLFELCDEEGILIWNDFMFACGIYPQDEAFLKNVAAEAEYIIKTYRNYTCLAIWAGDNENGQAYIWANRPYEFQTDKISGKILKEACRRFDSQRFYLPTSPGSPNPDIKGGDNPESPYQGDVHLYIMSASPGINAYRDYGKDYYKRVLGFKPRFVSEFGFISLPEKDSYYRFNIRREPLRTPEEILKFLPFVKEYLSRGEIEPVIYYSQLFNSLALKYWIEYFRSLKGICSGTLYWKFNDPLADCPDTWMYPSHMCSIDMYHKPKMTYYYTRRAYENTILSFIETETGLVLYGCTEELKNFTGQLTISRKSFDGKILAYDSFSCQLPMDCSSELCRLGAAFTNPDDPYGEYLKAEFETNGKIYENRYFFADLYELNKLKFPPCKLEILHASRKESQIYLKLYASSYARNVRIHILDFPGDYSDNYFDLDTGTAKHICIHLFDTQDIENTVLYIEGENFQRVILSLASL